MLGDRPVSRLTAIICAVVIALLSLSAWKINYYRENATEYKKQRDEKTQALNLANATITDMQVRQSAVAALDAKYTGDLADAKRTIEDLQRDVATGKRRLQLNATCKPMRTAASATGLDDATGPGLTDAAERDYFRLRERIEISSKQIAGLQEYIRNQCLR